MADEDIRKALTEHQTKVVESVQQINYAEAQMESHQRTITYSDITSEELKTLPEGTNVYESVGRMFYLQPLDDIQRLLVEKKTNAAAKIKDLKSKKSRLEEGMKESELHLRELLEQKKSQMS